MILMRADDVVVAQRVACRSVLAAGYWSASAAWVLAAARLAELLHMPRIAGYWRGYARSAAIDARCYMDIAGVDGCRWDMVAALCGSVIGASIGLLLARIIGWCYRVIASVVVAAAGGPNPRS